MTTASSRPGSDPQRKKRVVLVGWFRSVRPEGMETEFGGQGGFVDTLGPQPYSLANGYLKAFAEADPAIRDRYQIDLLNLAEPLELEDEQEHVHLRSEDLDDIVATQPDVVGFSTYCWNLEAVAEATTALRARLPAVKLILGGRGIEGDTRELLRAMAMVDIAVVGEAELPFRALLRRDLTPPWSEAGIYWRDGVDIHGGGSGEPVMDLDDIPSPYLQRILVPARHGVMMELSRGCLHACGYCTWSSNKRLRHFSPARIEAEIAWALGAGHRHITLNDAALNYDTDWLEAVVAAVRRADPAGRIAFTYNIRHDRLDERQLELLAQLPTHMVLAGIETFNAVAMERVDRASLSVEALRTHLGALARAVKPPVASIVLGLPEDSPAQFRRTLDTLLDWCAAEPGQVPAVGTVLVSLLQVYRGSKLWHQRHELGLRFAATGIPYLLEGPGWSMHDLTEAKAYLLERIAADPSRLKAAEAIALIDTQGGLDPWLGKRRLQALLVPWGPGVSIGAWTLRKIGVARDTGQAALLRFAWSRGGEVRVRVTRRRPGRTPRRYATALYELEVVSVGPDPDWPPREHRERLVRHVTATLARAEQRLRMRKRALSS